MDFKKYLQNDILAFWLKHAIDYENGGIFTQLERDGRVYGTEKSVWFQGRALWVFAKAYNYVNKSNEYLRAAENIYRFLPNCTDTDGRMFFTVTRDGKGIQKRRYYFSETFAAIGCAQYFKATQKQDVWQNATNYYNTARDCYLHPEKNAPKLLIDAKAHSPIMIMIATSRTMAECAPTAEEKEIYRTYAREFTREFLDGGFINEKVGCVLECVGIDGSFIDTPEGRKTNPGHALETAWFLLVEGLLENDIRATAAAKRIIDMTMARGVDKKHGGIVAFGDALERPVSTLEWDMKLWWPQNEAIIANRMAYALIGEEKYRKQYQELLDYAFKHFKDTEYGEWYGYLHYDSTPSHTLKGNIFKGPFHLPRMLMLLDAIEKGRLREFFS